MIITQSTESEVLDAALENSKGKSCLICGEQATGVHIWRSDGGGLFSKVTLFFFCLCDLHDSPNQTDSIADICEKSYFKQLTAKSIVLNTKTSLLN